MTTPITTSEAALNSTPRATLKSGTYYLTGDLLSVSQLATCGADLKASAAKNAPTPIPTFRSARGQVMYMPGSGFRSKLRGAACSLMLEALEARGARRFSLKDAQLNRVGGIKQAGAESNLDRMAFNAMVSSNPILGVFGAATPWVKGKAMVGHISCRQAGLEPMRIESVRADILRREPAMVEFLEEGALDAYTEEIAKVQRYVAIRNLIEHQKKILRSGTAQEKSEAKNELVALNKKVKDEDMQRVSPLRPLAGYLAIPPGSELDNQLALVRVSQIELGCFVASLARFAEEPVLGAHVAHGAGVIAGQWEVHKTGVGKIGSLKLLPFIGLEIDSPELIDAKAAFEAFIQTDACLPYSDESILAPESAAEAGDDNE